MHATQNVKFQYMIFHVKTSSCNTVFNVANTVSASAAVKTQILAIHYVKVD